MLSCRYRRVIFFRSRLRYKPHKRRDFRARCILYSTCQWGKQKKWPSILRLDNCFCNLVKMTRMAAASLAWLSWCDTSFSIVATLHECFCIFNLKVSSSSGTRGSSPLLIIARTYPSLCRGSGTAFHFTLPKKVEMTSQPVIADSLHRKGPL